MQIETFLQGLAFTIFLTLLIVVFANDLASYFPDDVRLVWYLYGLTCCMTLCLMGWAVSQGFITKDGDFSGDWGQILYKLLVASVDVQSSTHLGVFAFFIVVVPQLISYFLSGLSGCAGTPKLVSLTLTFVTWGFIKTFIVAAGVFTGFAGFAYFSSWPKWPVSYAGAWLVVSNMLMWMGFLTLYIYRGAPSFAAAAKAHCPRVIKNLLVSINCWLTRKLPDSKIRCEHRFKRVHTKKFE
jgi:hypothetical protein